MDGYQPTALRRDIAVPAVVTVHYFEYARDYVFEGEKHDFWELLYVDKGEVEVMADDTGYCLKQGEMIFHKPGEFHNVFANGLVAPNLVVVAFVCASPAMAYFEGKVVKAEEVERELLARIVHEARDAFSNPLDDPGSLKMERASSSAFGSEQMIGLLLERDAYPDGAPGSAAGCGSENLLLRQAAVGSRPRPANHRLYAGQRLRHPRPFPRSAAFPPRAPPT